MTPTEEKALKGMGINPYGKEVSVGEIASKFNGDVTAFNDALQHLEAMPNLEKVAIRGLYLTAQGMTLNEVGFEHLSSLKTPHVLEISDPKLVGIESEEIATFSNMKNLRKLHLFGNPRHNTHQLSGNEIMEGVGKLTQLQKLSAYRLDLRGDGGLHHLQANPNLNKLMLNSCKIDDSAAKIIATLPVTELDIRDTKIGNEGLNALIQANRLTSILIEGIPAEKAHKKAAKRMAKVNKLGKLPPSRLNAITAEKEHAVTEQQDTLYHSTDISSDISIDLPDSLVAIESLEKTGQLQDIKPKKPGDENAPVSDRFEVRIGANSAGREI